MPKLAGNNTAGDTCRFSRTSQFALPEASGRITNQKRIGIIGVRIGISLDHGNPEKRRHSPLHTGSIRHLFRERIFSKSRLRTNIEKSVDGSISISFKSFGALLFVQRSSAAALMSALGWEGHNTAAPSGSPSKPSRIRLPAERPWPFSSISKTHIGGHRIEGAYLPAPS